MKSSGLHPRAVAAIELTVMLLGLYLSWVSGKDEVERQAVSRGYGVYEHGTLGRRFVWLESRR